MQANTPILGSLAEDEVPVVWAITTDGRPISSAGGDFISIVAGYLPLLNYIQLKVLQELMHAGWEPDVLNEVWETFSGFSSCDCRHGLLNINLKRRHLTRFDNGIYQLVLRNIFARRRE